MNHNSLYDTLPPSISIILPVYNGEKYLRECLDSVLSQSFRNFEFIIWNDASTDSSSAIISSYQDPRIRLFANDLNQGLFKTLNHCIRHAKAPLIRLWSQDDVMKPNCLQVEAEFNEQHPEVGLSYCAVDYINEKGEIFLPAPHDPTPEIISPQLADSIMLYYGSITGNIANVMLKRDVLEQIGCFHDEMVYAGDFEMWVRISEKYPLGFIHEPLIYLRAHKGQFSRQSGMYVICMREEQTIYDTLIKRFPIEFRKHARNYNLLHRYSMYFHYAVRQMLIGEYKNAARTWQHIRQLKHPSIPIAFWLVTANRRLYKLKPKHLKTIMGNDCL